MTCEMPRYNRTVIRRSTRRKHLHVCATFSVHPNCKGLPPCAKRKLKWKVKTIYSQKSKFVIYNIYQICKSLTRNAWKDQHATQFVIFVFPGHEIGTKIGLPSELILAIQGYFGLQFSYLFSHPNIFWCPILTCHLVLGMLPFHTLCFPSKTADWWTLKPIREPKC